MASQVQVRFAPSPTGDLHIGNVRAALMNYLFARRHGGQFLLRIEDTDVSRNTNESGYQILQDLAFLGLQHDQGPDRGGDVGPYLQSERTPLYEKHLAELAEMGKVYRCFCSADVLEQKRKEQMAKGLPPRYDRTCMHLAADEIKQNVASGELFIWRFLLNDDAIYKINTLERGTVTFEMKHFADFALTRSDGTHTFLFTNFIDDWLMKITHVIRGEDHLSNTALQAALFDALAIPLPVFWHLPLLCDADGKKLSKREAASSLGHLRSEGYLPEAIDNYLASLGATLDPELQSLATLVETYPFDSVHATGAVRFDLERLDWFNHQWIMRLELDELVERVMPYLADQYPTVHEMDKDKLSSLIKIVSSEAKRLNQFPALVAFSFIPPVISSSVLTDQLGNDRAAVMKLLDELAEFSGDADAFVAVAKERAKRDGLKMRPVMSGIRYMLTGEFQGIGVKDLVDILGADEVASRLRKVGDLQDLDS